jgi:predicted ABC-type ATPase
MNLPILQPLLDGEQFDFDTLVDCPDETRDFLERWWDGRNLDVIDRPETISDDDPILIETVSKPNVDLITHEEIFPDILRKAIDTGKIAAVPSMDRKAYGECLIRLVGCNSIRLPDKPQLVFGGGGYGSGKTSTLAPWCQANTPLTGAHMVGVDYFKLFMPEFGMIQAVADGRASLTVQKECVGLANQLFDRLISAKRSFVWDSSMSNKDETLKRIKAARENGYLLTFIAVFTPLNVAIHQAMDRARETERFPNLVELPKSHTGFRQAFGVYVPLFDTVKVFARSAIGVHSVLVAEKNGLNNGLAIFDETLFNLVTS